MKASRFRLLWQPLKMLLSRALGPRMVWGFVRGDGEFLAHTRVSNATAVFAPQRWSVGDHVFVGHFCVLDASCGLTVGEGCQISASTCIFTHSSHAAIRLYGRSYVESAPLQAYFTAAVEIGAYTYIGAHSTVLPGSRIGKGCVVSAHSLVKGEFADFSIIRGIPATVVGDTRRGDAELLARHPELRAHYEAWAGRQDDAAPAPRGELEPEPEPEPARAPAPASLSVSASASRPTPVSKAKP